MSAVPTIDPPAELAAPKRLRWPALDLLRGTAVVWMIAYHFAFDLDHFGFIAQDMNRDPRWTLQRLAIVSIFVFSAGFGQALAARAGAPAARFWRRWAQIAGCALLVSAASWLMFPRSYIFFGVLHAIAVMLLVARPTLRWGAGLWLLGGVAVALPHLLAGPVFDLGWLRWLGLARSRPVTEDFVPLLPWIGVMWWGIAAARVLQRRPPVALATSIPRPLRAVAAIGRHSLLIYMLHQPLLIAAVGAAAWLLRRQSAG